MPGVPPIIAVYLSLDLFCQLGVPPIIDMAEKGAALQKMVVKHCLNISKQHYNDKTFIVLVFV